MHTDSDVIERTRRFDDAETGFGRVEGEGVGVGARHVLDAAITLLLSDAGAVAEKDIKTVVGHSMDIKDFFNLLSALFKIVQAS